MKVMITVLYLTIGIKGLTFSLRPCIQDPRIYTIEEMEKMVYAVANHKGVPPTVILNRILRKVRYRQRTDKITLKSPLQELALEELVNTKFRPPVSEEEFGRPPLPGQSALPPLRTFGHPQPLPPSRPVSEPRPFPPNRPAPPSSAQGMMTGVLFTPGFTSQGGSAPQAFPQAFYIPLQNLRPPPGVTIRVETALGNTLPEVIVTLSPMMTLVEALKQAESKFRSYLGMSPLSEEAVISFSRSSVAECYVIGSFNNIDSSDSGYWKIIVNDKSGKVIYDSICLPSRNEVAVKPGMTITLLYTLL